MWGRRRTDEDFAAEIRAHVELEVERLVGDGLDPVAARDQAHKKFGSMLAAEERFHESSRFAWLDQCRQDLRYAWRGLAHSRVFSAATIATLAVALGLSTVVFTIFNAYVLRPLAVREPFGLYEIRWQTPTAGGGRFSWREVADLRARDDVFEGILAEQHAAVSSGGRQLSGGFVSGNYFELLGAHVLLGRPLASFDAPEPGREPVAVLSHQAWTRLFDRDPSIVGRPLELNGRPFLVVGVMRPEFTGLGEYPRDVWLPLTMAGEAAGLDLLTGSERQLALTGRLRRDVTPAQAAAALSPLMSRLLADKGETVRAELRNQATPVALTWDMLAIFSPVFALFVLVLVTACANVSNMMLARANARHREIGVRLSLGASRGRVVRQLLTEGLLLAGLSCLVALGVAALALRAGVAMFVATLPPSLAGLIRLLPLGLDYRVFLFAFVVAGGRTVLFALLPALQATRLSLTHALRGEAGSGLRASRLRSLLVVGQVAASLVLIVVAATLARNGSQAAATDLGFRADGVLSVNYRVGGQAIVERAADLLRAAPHVGMVAATSQNPLFGMLPKVPVRTTADGQVVPTTYQHVSPEYFPLLGIPIVHGRGFQEAEAQTEALVAIINASGAKALWGGADPIGRTLRFAFTKRPPDSDEAHRLQRRGGPADPEPPGTVEVTIVGVARDVVSTLVYVGDDPAHLYLPTTPHGANAAALLVRGDTALTLDRTRTVLRPAHLNPMALEVLPLVDMQAMQLYPVRAASWVGTLLGAIALVLSISGLYGVLSYTLSQRVREIGIRMALGATAAAVVRLVAGQSARLVGWGSLLGLVVSYAALGLLSAVITLRNVTVLDAGAFLVAAALLALAAVLASGWPARRAARIDPAVTLRADG
jgi:predicted permease